MVSLSNPSRRPPIRQVLGLPPMSQTRFLRDYKGLYIGFTKDLKNRLTLHSKGAVYSTKNRRLLKLIHSTDHGVSLRRKIELDAKVQGERPINLTPEQRSYYSEAITKIFENIYSQPRAVLPG